MGQTRIEVHIPYALDGDLAREYNTTVHNANTDWVLLLDHDVFVSLNPLWYRMCIDAVNSVGNSVGMITCVEYGRNGFDLEVPNVGDIDTQIQYAKELYRKYGNELVEVENYRRAGFFMLVRKDIVDRFPFLSQGKGVNKIDHDFCRRITEAGYRIMIMKGLYVYHRRGVRKIQWEEHP